jgi:thiol-disulfide isomerase/thioredoxin
MNSKVKREVIEWTILIVVVGGLYFSGLHTEVIGFVQRGVLATGFFKPDPITENNEKVDYQWLLIDKNGSFVDFHDYQGKVVFLNFWATWCPPCIAEMPDIHALYQSMGQEVEFVMVSMDKDFELAKKFVGKKNFEFTIYHPASKIPANFNVSSIPSTYVLSPDGKIVSQSLGMAKFNTEDFRTFLRTIKSTSAAAFPKED